MELGSVAAIIGATVTLASVIGGILLKAFVTPVKTRTDNNHLTAQDHESRLRELEHSVHTHSIHLDTLMKAMDKLIAKIDLLVVSEYQRNKEDK